jgi:predicted TPR repeat methyltransferase
MDIDMNRSLSNRLSEREGSRLDETLAAVDGVPTTILDCGGGVGLLANALDRSFPKANVILADMSMNQLLRARVRHRVAADALALPFASAAFDLVVSTEVLEHIPEEYVATAFAELRRVARRDMIVTVPNSEDLDRVRLKCTSCGTSYHPHGHQRSYTEDTLLDVATGTEIIAVARIGPRRFRLPSGVMALIRRAGLLRPPPASAPCPTCASTDFELPGRRLTRADIRPQFRRPWLLIHCRVRSNCKL